MNILEKELKKALTKKLAQDAIIKSLMESVRWDFGTDFHTKYHKVKVDFKGNKYKYTKSHCTFEEDYGNNWVDINLPKILVTLVFELCELTDDEKVKVSEAKEEWGDWSKEDAPYYYFSNGEKEFFIILGYSLTFQQIENILKGQDNLPFTLEYKKEF